MVDGLTGFSFLFSQIKPPFYLSLNAIREGTDFPRLMEAFRVAALKLLVKFGRK